MNITAAAAAAAPLFEALESRRLLSAAANHHVVLAHAAPAAAAQVVVGQPRATGTGVAISAAPGVAFSGVIARIAGVRSIAAVSINWGDGTNPTTGFSVSRGVDGSFLVSASHTWQKGGVFDVAITATPASSGSTAAFPITVHSTARVVGVNNGVPVTIAATAAMQFTQSIGSFFASAGVKFTTKIDWGDGSPITSGTVMPGSSAGLFNLTASHTYAQVGQYAIQVIVTGFSGTVRNIAAWSSTANVIAPTLPPPT
jgi:hypothetical protein